MSLSDKFEEKLSFLDKNYALLEFKDDVKETVKKLLKWKESSINGEVDYLCPCGICEKWREKIKEEFGPKLT